MPGAAVSAGAWESSAGAESAGAEADGASDGAGAWLDGALDEQATMPNVIAVASNIASSFFMFFPPVIW